MMSTATIEEPKQPSEVCTMIQVPAHKSTYTSFPDNCRVGCGLGMRMLFADYTCTYLHRFPRTSLCMCTMSTAAAKLQALDESYAHKAEEETRKSQQAVEERMAVFQRECERQHQRQLEAEMAHFRERELARMREEERERCEEEVGRVREELQGAHRQKLEAVRKMELEALQRLRRKEQVECCGGHDIILMSQSRIQTLLSIVLSHTHSHAHTHTQELEAGVYTQRQALLEEMEVLKMREAELKRQAELNRQAASLEEERVRSLMEQLAGREKAMVEMKEQYEHMAEERIGR